MIFRQRLRTAFLGAFFILIAASPACAKAPYEEVFSEGLIAKYDHYLEGFKARHLYRGGTAEALLDEATKTKVVRHWWLATR